MRPFLKEFLIHLALAVVFVACLAAFLLWALKVTNS